MFDSERMEWTDDSDQQHEPEQQAAYGEEQRCHQQPEMKLGDDSQRLAFRSLHDDGPTCTRDGNSAEKPILAIWPLA